jgi:hypothetical protein
MKNTHGWEFNSKGFTLTEAMMVIGITMFVMSLVVSLAYTGMSAWQRQTARMQLESDAQNVMYILTYNLRQAQKGTVSISSLGGEQPMSLIYFTPINKSNPVSMFLKSVTTPGGKVMKRQIRFAEPKGTVASPVYTEKVVAQDVVSLYFTFPMVSDPSRVLINLGLQKRPFKNKAPVVYQAQEIVYVRN